MDIEIIENFDRIKANLKFTTAFTLNQETDSCFLFTLSYTKCRI